jgi:hypothetical protein
MSDLSSQLSQLTPEQRQAIIIQAQQQANQQVMQEMMKMMAVTCFDTCSGTSVRRRRRRRRSEMRLLLAPYTKKIKPSHSSSELLYIRESQG